MKFARSKPLTVLVIMLLGAIFQFGSALVITGVLSAESYGLYIFAISNAALVGSIACGGANRVLQRDIGRAKTSSVEAITTGISAGVWLSVFTVVALLPILLTVLSVGNTSLETLGIILVAIASMILGVRRTLDGAMIGYGHSILSSFTENILRPILIGLAIFTASYFFTDADPLIAYVLAVLSLLVFQVFVVSKHNRFIFPSPTSMKAWAKNKTGYFKANFGMNLLSNAPAVLIGLMSSAESVAVFAVAQRLSNVVLFALGAGNRVYAPKFAASTDSSELQKKCTRVSIFSFTVASVVALGMFIFKTYLLQLFGDSYAVHGSVVDALILTTLFSAMCGPCGMLLSMRSEENKNVICIWTAVAVLIVSSMLLVPEFGALGAAYAVLMSTLALNGLQVYFVYTHLGVKSGLMAFF